MGRKWIFISDVHMSALGKHGLDKYPGKHRFDWFRDEDAKMLGGFLDYLFKHPDTFSDVVFLGDLLDDWIWPVELDPPVFGDILTTDINAPVLDKIRAISGLPGKTVAYLRGNHDMGVAAADVAKHLPQVKFSDDIVFAANKLYAEHGHAWSLFNGVRKECRVLDELPLGYFISRAVATKAFHTGSSTQSLAAIIDGVVGLIGSGFHDIPARVFKTVLKDAGLDENTPIKMRRADGSLYSITAGKVLDACAGLPVDAEGIRPEVGNLLHRANELCKNGNIKAVVFGHSHKCYPPDDPSRPFITYGNAGCWCNEHEYHYNYVEVEEVDNPADDGSTFKRYFLRVLRWDGKKPVKLSEQDSLNPTEAVHG